MFFANYKEILGLLVFCATSLALTSGQVELDPYETGPFTPIHFLYDLDDTNLTKNVDIWAPAESGTWPAIYFSGSFAGTLPANTSVRTVLERISAWGFVIIAPWKLSLNPSENYHINFTDPILEFMEERLVEDLEDFGAATPYAINFDRMAIMGHSAGNHINVNYLKNSCGNFVASVFMSPVDGADPFGIIKDFAITPGTFLNYNMPTLILAAGLDPVRGQPLYPACAPANLSNTRYYDAMPGNRWYVNATQYGHADFFEPAFIETIEALSFCASDENTDKFIYQDFIAATVVAFLKGIMEPAEYCHLLDYVENPQNYNANVTTSSYRDVSDETRCQPATCLWEPPAETSTAKV